MSALLGFNGLLILLTLLFPSSLSLWFGLSVGGNVLLAIVRLQTLKLKHRQEIQATLDQAKDHERSSQVQSSQLSTIFANVPFPMALLDVEGTFVLTNQAFKRCVESDEIQRYDDDRLADELKTFFKQAYLRKEHLVKNLRLGVIDYQAIHVPISETQRYNGGLLMFLDITQILEGERTQKRFIADASHELKTPLTAILGMVEILNRPGFKDDETQREFLTQIEQESKRMDAILKDLLALSRQTAQKTILDLSQVKLIDLVQESYQTVKQQILQKNNVFSLDIDETLEVSVDVAKFHQVLTNLLANASKFTQDGTIAVKAVKLNNVCIIEVKDSGIGIALEDQAHIFDRFYRSDLSRARQLGGSGLGLAIVRATVQAHRGTIEVQSALGQGSSFIIRLPQ